MREGGPIEKYKMGEGGSEKSLPPSHILLKGIFSPNVMLNPQVEKGPTTAFLMGVSQKERKNLSKIKGAILAYFSPCIFVVYPLCKVP